MTVWVIYLDNKLEVVCKNEKAAAKWKSQWLAHVPVGFREQWKHRCKYKAYDCYE